jgi:hypothetical protein
VRGHRGEPAFYFVADVRDGISGSTFGQECPVLPVVGGNTMERFLFQVIDSYFERR